MVQLKMRRSEALLLLFILLCGMLPLLLLADKSLASPLVLLERSDEIGETNNKSGVFSGLHHEASHHNVERKMKCESKAGKGRCEEDDAADTQFKDGDYIYTNSNSGN